jgi:hypothetical protein
MDTLAIEKKAAPIRYGKECVIGVIAQLIRIMEITEEGEFLFVMNGDTVSQHFLKIWVSARPV